MHSDLGRNSKSGLKAHGFGQGIIAVEGSFSAGLRFIKLANLPSKFHRCSRLLRGPTRKGFALYASVNQVSGVDDLCGYSR